MPFSITAALQEGLERLFSRLGATFAGILFVFGILNAVFSATMAARFVGRPMGGPAPGMGPGMGPGTSMVPTVGLPWPVAAVFTLVLWIASAIVGIAALRAFVGDVDTSVDATLFTRNIGWVLVNIVVGGVVFGLAVAIGLVLLVVPGLFLLVSLIFWSLYVAVEDTSFVEGFRRSWALTSGHRIRLFGLGVVVLLIVGVVSGLFSTPARVGAPGIGALVVAQIGSAVTSVFTSATLARAWVQLRDLTEGDTGTDDPSAAESATTEA